MAGPKATPRTQGSMLIVALAVLTLLSIIAVTFAALMRLERRATENFGNRTKTTLLASSAESRVIAALRGGLYWNGFTHYNELNSPWIYGIKTARGEPARGNVLPLETASADEVSFHGDIGSSYPGGLDRYKVKLIDTASQINLNGRQDTLASMLDGLGEAIKKDPLYPQVNPFFSAFPESGRRIRGGDIILFRNKLEGNRFYSKAQLKEVIGEKNYSIVADFLTTRAWVDEATFRGSDGIEEFNNPFAQQRGGGLVDPTFDLNAGLVTPVTGSRPRLSPEPRSPININTAPEPVLIACIQGLGGRRAFPYTELTRQRTEEANRGLIDIDGILVPTDEELTLRQFPVWIYNLPFTFEAAKRIAQAIVARRKATPFTEWSTGQSGPNAGFVEWVNTELPDSVFAAPTAVTVVAPNFPDDARYRNDILNPSTPSGLMYIKGHLAREASIRRQRGLPFSAQNAWYFELVRGVLLANFNPNSRINKFNPNAPAYQAVDKANLVKLGDNGTNPREPRPGHTTEFSFDSNGIFEITTLAEMKGPGVEKDEQNALTYAEIKKRSIVKVWETVRHTTQADFEQPFQARGGYSSRGDREYVVTYPDAMFALHPDLYFGSNLDGRVELTGYLDALQEVLPANTRNTFFQGRQNILLYHHLKYRDERSTNSLQRLARGSRGGLGYLAELGRVLDPAHTRSGGNFRKRYSSYNWGIGADSEQEDKRINDPLVDTAANGSDLFPDGINSSMSRTSPLGVRLLRFPASGIRASPLDVGQLNRTYRNEIGNLAYYNGGVEFWLKLEFNGDDPTFSGLLGATQVQTRVGFNPSDSEGTQFYVWKNTKGQLRISRLYYHQAFLTDQTARALPLIGEGEEAEEELTGGDDELVDSRKLWARTDVFVDIADWRAHEWHHVVVAWNDEISGNRIRVLVDFEDVDAVSHNLGEGKFCALNVEEPKDVLYVGGFFRDQAVAREGLFKFGTNYRKDTVLLEPSVKRVLANATIDEFMTFSGSYSAPYGAIGYFTDKEGIYTNRFIIPFPEGIQRLRMRSLAWTVYPPVIYNSAPVRWTPEQNLKVSVANVGQGAQSRLPLNDGGGAADRNTNIAGRWLYATSNLQGKTGDLVYQVRMQAGLGAGQFGARSVGSPVLDDVTLSYYLPTAQILLSEAME